MKPLKWRVSDELWAQLEPLLVDPPRRFRSPGRNRYTPRQCLEGILYVLFTDTPWLEVPYRELGLPSGETCRRRLEEWSQRGLLADALVVLQERLVGSQQARLVAGDRRCVAGRREKGGEKVARSLLGRPGSRFHLAVDANGLPLAVRLTAGNENERDDLLPLIDELLARRIRPDELWADRGYHGRELENALAERGIKPRISSPRRAGDPIPEGTPTREIWRGRQRSTKTRDPQARHRWPVERTNAWLKAKRRIAHPTRPQSRQLPRLPSPRNDPHPREPTLRSAPVTATEAWQMIHRSGELPAAALEEDDVAPAAVVLAEPFPDADDPEADALVQTEALDVLGEDPRLDRPDARLLRSADELLHEGAADTPPAGRSGDVDRDLGDAGVDAATGDGGERRPAHDRAALERDEAEAGEMACVPRLPGRHLRLEGRVAGRNTLGVDPRAPPPSAPEREPRSPSSRGYWFVSVLGASGGTSRYCRSNFAIDANAGAATTPPKIDPRGSSTLTRTISRGCEAGTMPTNEAV